MLHSSDKILEWLSTFTRQLARFEDICTILDRILLEARTLTGADAGTVFLVENGELVFAYTHNDTLFPVDMAHKYSYTDARLPLDTLSIAGYCATHGTMLHLDDVRNLPKHLPFSFNENFDNATGYKTVSMLCLPLIGKKDTTLGVLQLINSLQDGKVVPFNKNVDIFLNIMAVHATNAIERTLMAKEMIFRMQLMAALHDPKETGTHVERVGAVAAELYQIVATKHNENIDVRRETRSQIRLAAMLHDLGKVAIPDAILKKNGKLTREEFAIMQRHCAEGSKLFIPSVELIYTMAREITMHHHQRWDGTGYTGDPEVPLLSGTDIPLTARITAVADVFDALVSVRCYKKAWSWEDAIALLRQDSGSHFDPEIVEAFFETEDTIKAIYLRYKG